MFKRFQSIIALSTAALVLAIGVQPAAGQLMFPRNKAEIISLLTARVWDEQLQVNRVPLDHEMNINRETENGWWIEFPDGGDLGTVWGPVCVDYSPDQARLSGNFSIYENNGPSWHRIQVHDGGLVNWWGLRVTIYWFECSPSGGGGTTATTSVAAGGGQSASAQQTAQQTQTQTTGSVTQTVDVDVNVSGAGTAAQPGTVIVTQPQAPQVPPAPPQAFCPLQPDHFAGFFPGTSVFDWSRTAPNGTQLTANGAYYRGNAVVSVPADHVVDTSNGRRFAGQLAQGPFSAYDLVRCA